MSDIPFLDLLAGTQTLQNPIGGVATLSDIMFLAKKAHDTKLKENHGIRTTTGDLCTLTAGSGKDLWFGRAKVNINNSSSTTITVTIQLKVNGLVKDQFKATLAGAVSDEGDYKDQYEFIFAGKVAATQIIKIEVAAISTGSPDISGDLICWEEDTGTTPII